MEHGDLGVGLLFAGVAMLACSVLTRRAANQENDAGKAYRVTVVANSGREQRVIHVGLQTRAQAQVTDGLTVGERVLVNRPQSSGTPQQNAARNNNAPRFNRGPQL